MAQWKRPGPLQRAGIANSRVFFAAIFAKPFLGRIGRERVRSPLTQRCTMHHSTWAVEPNDARCKCRCMWRE
jgi:hypothetical protein